MNKRYCVVGLGVRGISMFLKPLLREYADVTQVVGLCDTNPHRLNVALQEAKVDIPIFTDFDAMLREIPCDTVIIATRDSEHDVLIIKALEAGKNVIVEKPMTIDAPRCRDILAAEQANQGTLQVTFNYRYTPYVTRVKELLQTGIIGDIHSVQLAWYLDTVHGAEYYRRWHRHKEYSGGLFVHKATHHFDLINWWLDQDPVSVYALGGLNVYGPTRTERGERCLTCNYTDTCEFYMDIRQDDLLRRLYLEGETHDGYFRDRCVFAPEINMEDTMSALVQYDGGVQLNYSLHSFAPFEGWRAVLNGSKGRIEVSVADTYYPQAEPKLTDRIKTRLAVDPVQAADNVLEPITSDTIRIFPLFGGASKIDVPRVTGGHSGGDTRLRDMLFRSGVPDPLHQLAGSHAGAMSILIGSAANESVVSGQPVRIGDLLEPDLRSAAGS